jgi:hypothetical protein
VTARRLAAFTKKHAYTAATIRKARTPANGSGGGAMYCGTNNNSSQARNSNAKRSIRMAQRTSKLVRKFPERLVETLSLGGVRSQLISSLLMAFDNLWNCAYHPYLFVGGSVK